jgi:hypothetical protein
MIRRCLAFALTAVILGVPVTTAVCEAMCATRSATTTQHHSCHGEAPATGAALTAPAHPCGHPTGDIVGVGQSVQTLAAPALAILPASSLPFDIGAPVARSVSIQHSPPGTVAPTTTQLRV